MDAPVVSPIGFLHSSTCLLLPHELFFSSSSWVSFTSTVSRPHQSPNATGLTEPIAPKPHGRRRCIDRNWTSGGSGSPGCPRVCHIGSLPLCGGGGAKGDVSNPEIGVNPEIGGSVLFGFKKTVPGQQQIHLIGGEAFASCVLCWVNWALAEQRCCWAWAGLSGAGQGFSVPKLRGDTSVCWCQKFALMHVSWLWPSCGHLSEEELGFEHDVLGEFKRRVFPKALVLDLEMDDWTQ